MTKRYDQLTPAQQRQRDERDVAILDLLAAGWTYYQIQAELGVSPPTITAAKKMLAE